jgi:hypothetical protein
MMTVINFRNGVAALALGLAVVSAASSAMAAQKHSAHPGHAANAQALPGQALPGQDSSGDGTMTPARAQALRECSEIANKLVQKDWGVRQDTTMGSCMVSHGQMP